jgi:uncharacterized protein (TIGR03083 family)
MATDQELVDLLEQVWASMADLGAGLGEVEWKTPTEVPGWSVQDNLVHITGTECMILGRPAPEHELGADPPHVRNDIGRVNEIFVDSRRPFSGEQALAEFREVTAQRLAQLRGFGPDDFAADSWTPVGPGTVRDLLPFRVFDSWTHEQDMRRAVGRAGDLDTLVAENAMERIAGSMPYVVGKKTGAPDAATVVFVLDGPLATTFAVGVEGGRARRLDSPPDVPSARIQTDTETLARLACGRIDPAEALASGAVRVEGDEALGTSVVRELNFLF